MRNRVVIFLLFALSVLATSEFVVVFTTISPLSGGEEVYIAFFASLFLMLTTISSLIWYSIKRYLIYRRITPSLFTCVRQCALICSIIVLALFFNSLSILSFWDIAPLFISAILIEFFFQAEKTPITPVSDEPTPQPIS